MKKALLRCPFSMKILSTVAVVQIASFTSLYAMEREDDHHEKAFQIALGKHKNINKLFVHNGVTPTPDLGEAFLASSIHLHNEELQDLLKSTASCEGLSSSNSWDYTYYPRLFASKIANIMPSLSWPSLSFFSSSVEQPSAPVALVNTSENPTEPNKDTSNVNVETSDWLFASISEDWRTKHLDKEDTNSAEYLGLSLDGGGVRGLMGARWIEKLERETNQPVCKIFDIIGGTSIGGIGALALTTADWNGNPTMHGKDLADFLEKDAGTIFQKPNWYNLPTRIWEGISQLRYSRYSADPLKLLLQQRLGEFTTLETSLTRVLVTSIRSKEAIPHIFDSSNPTDKHCKIWELGLCTSAASTYFPAHQLSTDQEYYIDGGFYKNNPGVIVFKALMEMDKASLSKISILSLGTGNMPLEQIPVDAGLSSAGTIVNTLMATQSKATELTLEDLFKNKGLYCRVNPIIQQKIYLDQLDEESLRLLNDGADSQMGVIEKFAASEPVRRRLERLQR